VLGSLGLHLKEWMGPREGRWGGLLPPSSHCQPCVARESEPSISLLILEHRTAAGRKLSDSVCMLFVCCVACYSAVLPWFLNIFVSIISIIIGYCGLVVSVTFHIWILFGLPFWMPSNGKFNQIKWLTNTELCSRGNNFKIPSPRIFEVYLQLLDLSWTILIYPDF
jgi:hypothetical protein